MPAPRKATTGRATPRGTRPAGEPQPPKVTSASTWRTHKTANKGAVVTLPSGNVVRMLTNDPGKLLRMVQGGQVPNSLVGLVMAGFNAGAGATVNMAGIDVAGISSMMEFVDQMVINSVLEPKVYEDSENPDDDPPEDGIFLSDIDFMDRMFIFSVVVGGPPDVERFRQGQAQVVSAAQNGGGVPPVAVPDAAPGQRPLPGVVS